jgi:hypothetical protein
MANNANILAGGTDGMKLCWVGALGATAPTDSSTALLSGWYDCGGIADSGLTKKTNESTKDIKFFGSTQVQRTLVTDQKTTFQLAFGEVNRYSMAVYHRLAIASITPSSGAFSVTEGSYTRQQYAMVFDVVDGTSHLRYYCPNCEVTDRGDEKIANAEAIEWQVTVTAYPNTSGVAVQKFFYVPNA